MATGRRVCDYQDDLDTDSEPFTSSLKNAALDGVWGTVERPPSPQPGWSELKAVFDLSGALYLRDEEITWRHRGRREGGQKTIVEILRNATQYTFADLLDTLEQHYGLGPDEPDKDGFTQLHRAAETGDLGRLQTLLARNNIDADSNTAPKNMTPLMLACQKGHAAAVAALLAHHPPVDVNARDSFHASVLIHAVNTQPGMYLTQHNTHTFRIVKQLLATGRVDVNYTTPDRGLYARHPTALTAAMDRGDADSTRSLLEAGADPGIQDFQGRTALHRARGGAVARALLDAGVDPGVRDSEGQTALLCAARFRYRGVAEALLERGAQEIDVPAADGRTPLTVAFSMRDEELIAVLLRAGAKVDFEVLRRVKMTPYGNLMKGNEEMIGVVRRLLQTERL